MPSKGGNGGNKGASGGAGGKGGGGGAQTKTPAAGKPQAAPVNNAKPKPAAGGDAGDAPKAPPAHKA
ncbi:uncharacterized protein EHS24_008495 [Apiotrichum porosum]|uniref:Uncharacterized protein n=1 Tax=Apiotrichum porosum TaxID=105984 RepID=A0A427XQH8_9TREE|nr:uncharacterized protein EHS24_008495 [Apiotrichum porosum]RSH81061.1 hypothetical protein EHS24_008495 [Apiotrichum porosum]